MPRLARCDPESCSSTPTTASSALAPTPPSRCPTRTHCAATWLIRHDRGLTMLLAIDVGNTNTVLGCFGGDKLVESGGIKTAVGAMAAETALPLRCLLIDEPRPAGIVACSTVPAVLHELRGVFDRY